MASFMDLLEDEMVKRGRCTPYDCLVMTEGINSNTLPKYLQYLSYIPKHWNIEAIYERKGSELSNLEIEHLAKVKQQQGIFKLLEKALTTKMVTMNEVKKIRKYINSFPLIQVIEEKLSQNEKERCINKIEKAKLLYLEELDLYIDGLKGKSINIEDDYILLILESISLRRHEDRLNADISDSVEADQHLNSWWLYMKKYK